MKKYDPELRARSDAVVIPAVRRLAEQFGYSLRVAERSRDLDGVDFELTQDDRTIELQAEQKRHWNDGDYPLHLEPVHIPARKTWPHHYPVHDKEWKGYAPPELLLRSPAIIYAAMSVVGTSMLIISYGYAAHAGRSVWSSNGLTNEWMWGVDSHYWIDPMSGGADPFISALGRNGWII